jgi:hypothetical protein
MNPDDEWLATEWSSAQWSDDMVTFEEHGSPASSALAKRNEAAARIMDPVSSRYEELFAQLGQLQAEREDS